MNEDIKPQDLSISSYREPNKGQWNQNPDRGITIKHIPSGITTACHSERSSHANRAKAMVELNEKLKDWNGVVAPSLKQQLQTSQSECAALKVEVNELRERLIYWAAYPGQFSAAGVAKLLQYVKEQSLATHDNEVIDRIKTEIKQSSEIFRIANTEVITLFAIEHIIRNLKAGVRK